MADEHDGGHGDGGHGDGEQSHRKKAYQAPRLVHYGDVATLTAGGSGVTSEFMGMDMCANGQSMRVSPLCP